jgi:hypothetical protein
MVKFIWGNTYGIKKPLVGLYTTSGIESKNTAYSVNKLRHQPSIIVIMTHFTQYEYVQTKFVKLYSLLHDKKIIVCKETMKTQKHETTRVRGAHIIQCDPTKQLYNVMRRGKTVLLGLETKKCAKCYVCNQLGLPC